MTDDITTQDALINNIKSVVENPDVYQALQKKKNKAQGIGAGIWNNVLYFGTTINVSGKERTAIITSDKKIYADYGRKHERGNEIRKDFGLNYRFDFFGDLINYDWSNESISEFLFGTPKDIGLVGCYELILEKEKKYVWHPQEGYYETIACDVLSTYFIPLFSSKGRTFFNAEKGSGKTQQSNIYVGLAFHPLFSGNISGASTYRIIESVKPTLIVDDFDKIPEEQKISFDQTLRVGYKKGARAVRSDDKIPLGFDLFSHMIINNIYGLDDVSESRCSKHILERCPVKFNAIDIENAINDWQKERDLLYTNALLHWLEVKEAYALLDIPELVGRERERDSATLAIAKLVGAFDKVKNYLLINNSKRSESDLENDFAYHLLLYIKNELEREEYVQKNAKDFAEAIAEECITAPHDSQYYKKEAGKLAWQIGKLFTRMEHAVPSGMTMGKKRYKIDKIALKRIAWAKGYSLALGLDKPELSPPNPTNTTNYTTQPNLPNLTKKTGGEGGQGGLGDVQEGADIMKNIEKEGGING